MQLSCTYGTEEQHAVIAHCHCHRKKSMLTTRVVNSAYRPDKGKKAAGVGRLAKVAFDEVLGGSSGYGWNMPSPFTVPQTPTLRLVAAGILLMVLTKSTSHLRNAQSTCSTLHVVQTGSRLADNNQSRYYSSLPQLRLLAGALCNLTAAQVIVYFFMSVSDLSRTECVLVKQGFITVY